MRTKTVILLLCAFLASSLLLGIGYATLNDTLTVSGTGDLSAVSPGIHIIAVAPPKECGGRGLRYVGKRDVGTC